MYEKVCKASKRKSIKAGGDKKSENYRKSVVTNPSQAVSTKEYNPTTDKILSGIAGVSEKTYRMGAKVLKSNNENIKQRAV